MPLEVKMEGSGLREALECKGQGQNFFFPWTPPLFSLLFDLGLYETEALPSPPIPPPAQNALSKTKSTIRTLT